MNDLTVTEWLEQEELSEDEIDFLLTFIPNISVIKSQPSKAVVIYESMNRQFPKINLKPERKRIIWTII